MTPPANHLDGVGLDPWSLELLSEHGGTVHARIGPRGVGAYPTTACGAGLGEWWTGLAAEVTCPVCRAWLDRGPAS